MKNDRQNYLIILLVNFCFLANAQGLILDDVGYDTTPRLPLYNGRKAATTLPASTKLALRPTPDDQNEALACTAFAGGYGAYSMLQAMRRGEGIGKNLYSSAYVFSLIGYDPTKASLKNVLDKICKNGSCLKSTFPNEHIAKRTQPPPNAVKEATNALFPMTNAVVSNTIEDIKQTIGLYKLPVIIGAKVEGNFKTKYMAKDFWQPQVPSVNHAMLVVGYDNTDDSFEIMNSYGANWGKSGFIKIKQADLVRKDVLLQAFVLTPTNAKGFDEEEAAQPIIDSTQMETVGLLGLKNLISINSPNSFVFEPTKVKFNKDLKRYETERRDWVRGEVFQFLASQILANHYLYVFSVDAENKLNIHWPPDARWQETNKQTIADYAPNIGQKPVSAVILSPETELTLPAHDKGLQVNAIGEDHLIVLVSTKPVTDFRQRLDKLKITEGPLSGRLNTAFGDILTPFDKLTYFKDKMMVRHKTYETQGWVVPVVLSIAVK